MRNLLIAALFHDFDHPGDPHPSEGDPDRINIPIAITGLRRYVMPADRPFLPQIEALIEATHYPYKIGSDAFSWLGDNGIDVNPWEGCDRVPASSEYGAEAGPPRWCSIK